MDDDMGLITERMIDNADREKSGAAATPLGSVLRNELVLDFFERRELPVVPRPKARVVFPGVKISYEQDDKWGGLIVTQRGVVATKPTPPEELTLPIYDGPYAPDAMTSLLASSAAEREWAAFTAAREAVRPTKRMLQSWVKTDLS
jgi:hypothetical protein